MSASILSLSKWNAYKLDLNFDELCKKIKQISKRVDVDVHFDVDVVVYARVCVRVSYLMSAGYLIGIL